MNQIDLHVSKRRLFAHNFLPLNVVVFQDVYKSHSSIPAMAIFAFSPIGRFTISKTSSPYLGVETSRQGRFLIVSWVFEMSLAYLSGFLHLKKIPECVGVKPLTINYNIILNLRIWIR